MEISEIGKIAAIDRLLSGYQDSKSKDSEQVAHNLFVEGIDFSLSYFPLKHLGLKIVQSVVGQLYAKFQKPKSLSIILSVSSRFHFEDINEFWDGVIAAARKYSIIDLNLDLTPSPSGLTISVSSYGVASSSVKHPKPESKDLICISGNTGAALMGLHILERERVAFSTASQSLKKDGEQPNLEKYKYVIGQYLSPSLDENLVNRFVEKNIFPSYGYFVTKGLASAIKQYCKDNNLGAKIYLDKIPISAKTFEVSEELRMDAVTAALNGGDDYRFLFTFPIENHDKLRKEFGDFDIIGHTAQKEVGAVLMTPDGVGVDIKAQGW